MLFHLLLGLVSVIAATRDGKGMDTPRLTVYLTNLTWIPNATDALVPKPRRPRASTSHMTLWFFLLSALARSCSATTHRPLR